MIFFHLTPRAKATKQKQLVLHQTKKETINKMKTQPME